MKESSQIINTADSERLDDIARRLYEMGKRVDDSYSGGNINYDKEKLTLAALTSAAKVSFFKIQAKHAEQRILENTRKAKRIK